MATDPASLLVPHVARLIQTPEGVDPFQVAQEAIAELQGFASKGDVVGPESANFIKLLSKGDAKSAGLVARYVNSIQSAGRMPEGVVVGGGSLHVDFDDDGETGMYKVPAEWVSGDDEFSGRYLSRFDDSGRWNVGRSKGRPTRRLTTAGASHVAGGPILTPRPLLPEGDVSDEAGHRLDYIRPDQHPSLTEGFKLHATIATSDMAADAGKAANLTRFLRKPAEYAQPLGASNGDRRTFGRALVYSFDNADDLARAFEQAATMKGVRLNAYTPTPMGVGNKAWVDVRQRIDGGLVERLYDEAHPLMHYVETNVRPDGFAIRQHKNGPAYVDEGSRVLYKVAPDGEGKVDLQQMMKDSMIVAENAGKPVKVEL